MTGPCCAGVWIEILSGQLPLIQEGSAPLEEEAQRMAERLLQGEADVTGTAGEASSEDLQTVAVDSVELTRPRSVGVEQVGRWALEQLGLVELLAELGLNGPLRAAAVGAIVGRLARPGSERATWGWLRRRSGLGELLDFDFQTLSLMQMYRASDALMRHRQAIEAHLFTRAMGLFDLAADRHPVRSDPHFLRRGGPPSTQGPAGALEGEAQRLSPADPGVGAGRGRVCAPLPGLCRPGG